MPTINKQDNAANAMAEATAWLDENGIGYEFLPPYQIKINQINFWPRTGTITVDGEAGKRVQKGLAGLEQILELFEILRVVDDYSSQEDNAGEINTFRQIKIASHPPKK